MESSWHTTDVLLRSIVLFSLGEKGSAGIPGKAGPKGEKGDKGNISPEIHFLMREIYGNPKPLGFQTNILTHASTLAITLQDKLFAAYFLYLYSSEQEKK